MSLNLAKQNAPKVALEVRESEVHVNPRSSTGHRSSALGLEPCVPLQWASTGHAQTIIGHFWPSPRLSQSGKLVILELADGDELAARFYEGSSSVLVYLFHGLGGSTDSTYIHRTARLMLELGHSVLMVNHRGCGEGAGLAVGPYHSGRGEDVSDVVKWGRKMFPHHRHLAIGFSLGGNALLNLVSGQRGTIQPDLALAVNSPIDLASSSEALVQGFNRIYDTWFFYLCRRGVLHGRKNGSPAYDLPYFATLREFDDLYTAPAGGFQNRADYYARCSTANRLDQIQIPTVLLSAHDDPFVKVEAYLAAKPSSSVIMHLEHCGGHMGYISNEVTPIGTRRWQDYAIRESVEFLLKNS